MIRVLLAQGGTLLRGALAAVLSTEDDLEVVAEVARVADVLVAVSRDRPDVVVLDHALPGSTSTAGLCQSLVAAVPGCAVLVTLDRRAIAAMGSELAKLVPRVGLIATEASLATLVDGVRRLAHGDTVLDVELAVAALTAQNNPLTDREREVLRLARDGVPAKEIAKHLYLSAGTVRNYLARTVVKTGARTRLEAIRIAQEAGWI